ncbi:sugar ABC transporter substrate-binding protein [Luteococcus peritonei]|uniref:ABC transporter substrate-binding protein n=1 Tax=Luteococcus peritonei TaxID=88874 RepID=A0ABW4RWU4_9ACTN
MTTWTTRLAAAVTAAALALVGCSAEPEQQQGSSNTITYWLWDSAQQPGYQKCAEGFQQANPGLKVDIVQMGWDDYWSKLTAGFIADQAPDVFTNHLGKYAQFVDLGVLLPLDDLEATKDIDSKDYQEGLGEVWVGQDGKRYGAPKDWDTVAYFYDRKKLAAAGITAEQLEEATWNPDDGGSFEKIVAHLTVDAKGVRGDEPGFDKDNVKVYGLSSDGSGGGNFGQTQWGPYAYSLGWQVTDKNPWGTHFRFDDPDFRKTVAWYYGLAEKGYLPKFSTFGPNTGGYAQFAAGRSALSMNGSWMISSYASLKDVDLAMAPTPIGPSGKRGTPFNGLADSITKYSRNPQAAAKWVAWMASDQCQDVIGAAGVVFPARPSGTRISLETRRKAGLDVTAFTSQVEQKTTVMQPVVQNAADLTALTEPEFDALFIGSKQPDDLAEMNNQINKLFEITAK